MKLHASGEDYLETILVLQKKRGMVRSVDVARHLDVSKPSVSHAVTTLRDGGFLTMDEDYFLHLTDIGREVAEQIYEKHRFFTERLIAAGVDPETAERDACRIEQRVRDLVSRTRLEVYIVSSAQDAIRQMLVHTFDVIALHTAVEGAVPLCTFLLDLRHVRNTLLLLYPVPTAEARTHYYRRGFDLCLPEDDPGRSSSIGTW